MKLERWLNKLYANFNGYFWLPCPLCGEYFGGHEVGGSVIDEVTKGVYEGRAVCKKCRNKAQKINYEFWLEYFNK